MGQARALSALNFGLNIADSGFNIYVSGVAGTGRTTAIKGFLEEMAGKKPPPPDWCYVYNFHDSYRPRAFRLPPGQGLELQKDMKHVIESASRSIAQAFASKEYGEKREEITSVINKQREESFRLLNECAREAGFTVQTTPSGLVFIPSPDGQPMTPEQYETLSSEEKERISQKQEELNKILREELTKLRSEERATQQRLESTDRDVAHYAISYLFEDLEKKYHELESVLGYLNEVREDITTNLALFTVPQSGPQPEPMAAMQALTRKQALGKYEVNVLVDNSALKGAPVVLELNPTFNYLFGRIEKEVQYGALYTDFTMVKGGSMHQANGGYLVVRALDVLTNFQSWEGLKRALRDRKLVIEEIGERLGYLAARSLNPEPIPLDIKVIMIGDPHTYYLLYQRDPAFKELFKVKADFDTRMERSEENLRSYAAVICRLCQEEKLRHLKSSALAKLIEFSTRMASDQEKLSTLFSNVADVVREANFWAGAGGKDFIEDGHVIKAIEQRVFRSNLIQERLNEMIANKSIMLDTEGERIGQVNGLAVADLGDYSFGRPGRITASVGMGREGLVDIEREAKLGGRLHTKGVMILIGYLTEKYVQNVPLSLSARLVFEQSYEEIEGDSASSTELYAILSRLAGVPIKQGIAVTGSVNQKGEVQAIGGVNQKIEGYFEVCRIKGFNGKQGVMIPASNVRNLMLKEEVVAAVKAGDFHIYPVSTINEGIEVLTGMKAGEPTGNGNFKTGSFNDRVQKKLLSLAEKLREFAKTETATAPAESKPEGDSSDRK
jgi:lon-related putative ATP-dependent protease